MKTDREIKKEGKDLAEELFTKTEVENTPFSVITYENQHYVSFTKKYRLSEAHKTLEEAIKDAETITWNRITALLSILKDENIL